MGIVYVGPPRSPVEPGDLLLRPKETGIGWHYATGVSGGFVKDNTPEAGKHLTTFEGVRDMKMSVLLERWELFLI